MASPPPSLSIAGAFLVLFWHAKENLAQRKSALPPRHRREKTLSVTLEMPLKVPFDFIGPAEDAAEVVDIGIAQRIQLLDGVSAAEVLPDKDAPWLVYCRTGRRSADAVQKLDALGYTNIYDLGGILSWPYEIEGDFEGHF